MAAVSVGKGSAAAMEAAIDGVAQALQAAAIQVDAVLCRYLIPATAVHCITAPKALL